MYLHLFNLSLFASEPCSGGVDRSGDLLVEAAHTTEESFAPVQHLLVRSHRPATPIAAGYLRYCLH